MSDYYLRRCDTVVNTLEHMVVQPYIWCGTVRHLVSIVMRIVIEQNSLSVDDNIYIYIYTGWGCEACL